MFGIIMALLGGAHRADSPDKWADVGIWICVVFFSVLVHELGHALAVRYFKLPTEIILHGFGGVTIMPAGHLSRGQSIFVSSAGPLAGLLLGGIFLALFLIVPKGHAGVDAAITYGLWVNFFWTFINLLPIQPMDGGQILRDILGPTRFRITCIIGMLSAVAVGLLALQLSMVFLAFFMFYFAYLNYRGQANDGGVIKR